MIDLDRLKCLLRYEPDTGKFIWLVHRQRARLGRVAGTICPMYGYRMIGIDYKRYRASRLAWLYMMGEWPSELIDHRDRDRSNDKWENLRPATWKQNSENRSISPSSLSGRVGVNWQPSRNRWIAQIKHNGVSRNLGRFVQLEDAIAARVKAESYCFTHR